MLIWPLWNIVRYKAEVIDMYWAVGRDRIQGITPLIHLIRGREMHQEINKGRMIKIHMIDTVTTAPKLTITTHHMKNRSYRSTTSDVISWTKQASCWTPKGSEINEHPNRMPKSEAKINISEDEKKAVTIIQTQMGCWSTDVATSHQSTTKWLQRTNKQVRGQSERLQ